jgi:hypothetical protein
MTRICRRHGMNRFVPNMNLALFNIGSNMDFAIK